MHWADSQNTVVSSPYSLSTHSRIYHHRNFTVMMSETVQWTMVKVWHSWCGFPVISTIRCHSSYKRNCTCVQNKIHLHFWGMIRFALPSVTPWYWPLLCEHRDVIAFQSTQTSVLIFPEKDAWLKRSHKIIQCCVLQCPGKIRVLAYRVEWPWLLTIVYRG